MLSKSGVSIERLTSDDPDFKVVKEKRFNGCNVKIVCVSIALTFYVFLQNHCLRTMYIQILESVGNKKEKV